MSEKKDYSEKDAKQALKAFFTTPEGRAVGGRVKDAYDIKERPRFLCFPMMAWLMGDEALPPDIRQLPTSSKALKTHMRPDGAIYLGAFELPDDPGSTVIVFGDGLTDHKTAENVSIAFRQRLTKIATDRAEARDPNAEPVVS